MYICVCICVCVCIYIYTYIYICICIYVCVYVYVYVYVYVCVYLYVYVYVPCTMCMYMYSSRSSSVRSHSGLARYHWGGVGQIPVGNPPEQNTGGVCVLDTVMEGWARYRWGVLQRGTYRWGVCARYRRGGVGWIPVGSPPKGRIQRIPVGLCVPDTVGEGWAGYRRGVLQRGEYRWGVCARYRRGGACRGGACGAGGEI